MIRSLHEGLGIPYDSLLAERARDKSASPVPSQAVDRLNTLGFKVERNDVSLFISSTLQTEAPFALLRKTRTQRASFKSDPRALLLWRAAVLQRADATKLAGTFDHAKFRTQDFRPLARMSALPDGPRRAIGELGANGVVVVVLPSLPGTFLDGAAMLSPAGTPVIGLTLRHDRIDGFWFTLLHEASHIALHYDLLRQNNSAFVDDMEIRSEEGCEREADDLARNALIPPQFLSQVHWGRDTTNDEVATVATRARVHTSVVAGRWQRDHNNYKKFSRLIERDTLRTVLLPTTSAQRA
jgi:HTH-type transcriptional regulator / antitoxin HigA